MSEQDEDERFWNMADAFVELANEQAETSEPGEVGAAILYAAARFNAFFAASEAESAEELRRDMDRSTEYFGGEFNKAFKNNLEDFADHFDEDFSS